MKRLLIAGATGLVGGEALAMALSDERVSQVVAPTRRALPPHPKLLNPIVDPSSLPTDADWWQVDGGLCAIGTTRAKTPSRVDYRAIDSDYPLAIATRIREGGATRFALTSSMGANAHSAFFYTSLKGELEDAVMHLAFPSLTIVRPGIIGGKRTEPRPMEQFICGVLRVVDPLLPPIARVNPARTIARFLLDAAAEGPLGSQLIDAGHIAKSRRVGD